ncbi:cytochrome P450 [Allokutzneria sp. A3M-2-11 16]|uniref:cytochrome P450 n=1 Tax=Allokutzneria sp. A3M-2-11 16 TaxID=2962043 RepID=UPI0020B6A123|nr:cytochrome P450 [Allokutzneria sp. A3M-2-11 16]MCP3800179.1 cytochrome P450 [Allokutzneria sp. A3M-2-11 16]
MTSENTEIPRFPMTRCPGFDPPAEYERLRAELPVAPVRLRHGQTAWLVTRYADVRRVLSDPARFSSDPAKPGYPQLRPVVDKAAKPGSFLVTDPPLHTKYRRILAAEFSAARMEALRPAVSAIVDDCVDALFADGAPSDVVRHVSVPVPAKVISLLLGVPESDQAFFIDRSRRHLDRSLPADQVGTALAELEDYLDRLIAKRTAEPGTDLLSRLAVRHLRTGELTREEFVGMSVLLLVGGFETTANAIALSVLALHEQPGQWADLVADPDRAAGAADELLRYLGLAQHGVVRAAVADVEVGGRLIKAGEGVIVALSSANRDAGHYADADRLDVCRPAGDHMTFGWGMHKCIGQHLARLELEVVLRTLLRRAPGLRVDTALEELEFLMDAPFYGVRELPVTW